MSLQSKSINDAYYTPRIVVEQMARLVGDVRGKVIYDPCCGDGRLTNPFKEHNQVIQVDLPHFDYLKVRPIFKPDIIVMNPPFSLDVEFIQWAASDADEVFAILPLSWSKMSKLKKLPYWVDIRFIEKCESFYYETPFGKRRVRTGIYYIRKFTDRCRLDWSQIYTTNLLKSMGITWSKFPVEGSYPLRVRGSSAGKWLAQKHWKSFSTGSTAWISFDDDEIKNIVLKMEFTRIAKFSTCAESLDVGEFTREVYLDTPH